MATQVTLSDRNTALLDEASTAELVREAMDGAKELLRIEVELARQDVKTELGQMRHAAIGLAVAAGAGVIILCLLAVALVFALGGTGLAALAVAGGLLVIGGIAAWIGYGALPKAPLEKTRSRMQEDVSQLKEHIA